MIRDVRDVAGNLAQLLGPVGELLADAVRRDSMAASARAIGKPEAAAAVADALLRMF